MSFDKNEINERVSNRVDDVEDSLDHIPNSYSMPDLESMKIGSAKKFRLGIVFIDIANFTSYTERNDPYDVLFMLNMFIPEIMEVVRDYNGDFEKNTGDGILAYFGASDDDHQTSHTILEYIATVKYALANCVNPALENKGIEQIRITAGANIGTVHISRIGVNRLNRRTAVGFTPNVAATLEEMADTNQYYVNQGIHQYANEADCNWAEYLHHEGRLPGYTWGGEKAQYYRFNGIWSSTDIDNL